MKFDINANPVESCLVLLLMVIWLGLADSVQRVARQLRDAHPRLWDQLGSPDALVFGGLLGPLMLTFAMVGSPEILRWMISREHRDLKDADMSKHLARVRFFFVIFTATVITTFLYAVFRLVIS